MTDDLDYAFDAPPAPRASRPYRVSWADVLFGWVDRLPLPAWSFYALAFAVGYVAVIAARMNDGLTLAAALRVPPPVFLFWMVGCPAIMHYLDRVALARVREFRPALRVDDAEFAEIEWSLTTMPALPALWHGLGWLAIAAVIVVPSVDRFTALGYSRWEITLTVLSYFVGGVLSYHTLRQLREVRSLYARVGKIDLFHRETLNALPGLTARTSICWLVLLFISFRLLPPEVVRSAFGATEIAAIVLAIAAFVAPLLGMHARLDEAQREEIAANGERLRRIVTEFHERIDAGELEDADRYQKAASALLAEQERLEKMSTWPWSTTTLRGFVTALLLPIVLKFGQELLTRLLSFGS